VVNKSWVVSTEELGDRDDGTIGANVLVDILPLPKGRGFWIQTILA